jgi:hypothetical protein
MLEGHEACAVCGGRAQEGARMSQVVIEGRALTLCRAHAQTVIAALPETFEELRQIFVGEAEGFTPDGRLDRRSPIDRRAAEDRRVFPPRAEGRRQNLGRRASDPRQ